MKRKYFLGLIAAFPCIVSAAEPDLKPLADFAQDAPSRATVNYVSQRCAAMYFSVSEFRGYEIKRESGRDWYYAKSIELMSASTLYYLGLGLAEEVAESRMNEVVEPIVDIYLKTMKSNYLKTGNPADEFIASELAHCIGFIRNMEEPD